MIGNLTLYVKQVFDQQASTTKDTYQGLNMMDRSSISVMIAHCLGDMQVKIQAAP